jgi:hypothetical protein
MSILTGAIYDVLANDATLAGLLATYNGQPAVFTIDPAPGDAVLPYVVTAGEVSQAPEEAKNCLGRELRRDVRCYAAADGSAVTVEAIAERVRTLLHRQAMVIPGFVWILGDCDGPIAADEVEAYGRIVTVRLIVEEL